MAGTDFLDALRATFAARSYNRLMKTTPTLSVVDMLAAVLLDDTGMTPSDLLQGTTVLYHDDYDVADAIRTVLRTLFPDGLVVFKGGSHHEQYNGAVSRGVPVVIVFSDRIDFDPIDAVLLADRNFDVGEVGQSSIIAALTQAVSGTAIHLADADAEKIGFGTLIRCCPLHSTRDDCARRIRTWLDQPVQKVPDDGLPQVRDPGLPVSDPVPVGVAAGFVVRRLSQMSGFGEAATWGMNLAADLQAYRDGTLPWSDVDRGVLISGPPGGGKTTFAQALALECDVKLVPTTYTDWSAAASGYGDTMSKGLTKLFEKWRKLSETERPFILFIDEIDTIGRRGGNGNNESWFTAVINAWLAFLDGAVPRDGIVVIAATNYPDRVDPALMRPGRLDRHVELPMPDLSALVGIVRAHLGPDAISTDDELTEAARAVRGRSPATIQQLCREARRAARWCKRRVCASDLTDVVAMQRLGSDPTDERQTAIHEAGHAVALIVMGPDRLTGVDIDAQRTSMQRGLYSTRAIVEARLTMLLSARAAEEVILGAPTSGASLDLSDATHIAMEAQGTWGFGSQGLMSLPAEVAWSDRGMRDAVQRMLHEAYDRAQAFVREHRGAIERVADALVVRRYLDGGEVRALVAGPVPTPAPVRRSAPMHGPAVTRTIGPVSARGPT